MFNVLFAAEYFYANPDFVRLSEELARRDHRLSVATSMRVVDQPEHKSGLTIFNMEPLATIYSIPHTLSFPIFKISDIVKTHGINVIHAINDHSTNVASASLLSRATDIPFVYTIQGPGTRTGHPLVDTIVSLYDLTFERWIAKAARKVILLSKSLISTAEKLRIDKEKISVIPSGVDNNYFDPGNREVKRKTERLRDRFDVDDKMIVGFVGRLVPAKGLGYLFSAIKTIQKENSNIVLLIVGDGAQRRDLEIMAKNLKVKAIFAGWQHDLRPYYSLMDIFVLPSLFEGLPNVILEAMAMRIPVVATSVGGNPDVVSNDENGFLVPPRNFVKLAAVLERLVEDKQLRIRMGKLSRMIIQKDFQWSTAVDKVEKVYRELA
ncbi:MAG: glycosyltransferase family 4 protein [Candidatus Bathyarchaeota archaeon]